ncbi:hypothetical protein QT971_05040 [Microcoleus sp. herbarium19]|uniref:hypothetical protein n=1 Tax=Microcoleus sp. herbarium19 TaxID=3055440 RepID=UPI002FD2B407
MKVTEICQLRNISIIDISTPILVPSFSSRGFPEVRDIYNSMRDFIVDVSLVSAYDLYYDFIDRDIYYSDLIFIDSGGYETQLLKSTASLDDVYAARDSCSARPWNSDLHQSVLDRLEPNSQFVFISYDSQENSQPILCQIESSLALFQKYPDVASEFLGKPEQESNFINIGNLIGYLDNIAQFSILGLTEKELGKSILERCQNLLRLRSEFEKSGFQIPIHILGCLDPVLIIAYFLCGADIFDGLAWLRYVFYDGLALYPSTANIITEKWNYSEQELANFYGIQNIQTLNRLTISMIKFCKTRRIEEFFEWNRVMPSVLNLVRNAGLEI